MRKVRTIALLCGVTASLFLFACKREERGYRVSPPMVESTTNIVTMSALHPGPGPTTTRSVSNEYSENAYALAQGERLFNAFNCVGCHAHGGGGMGPPLMDNTWIYGGRPEQVYATILEGRPNGMPSWRGRIPDYQVWQIVAYVRGLSGLVSGSAAPGRSDHMRGQTPENSTPTQFPGQTATPPSVEMPR